jgi:methyl-accepting chemotaxis protein
MSSQLNRYRIRSRIYVGFGTLVVLILGLALFCIVQLTNIKGAVDKLSSLSGGVRVIETGRLLETLRRTAQAYDANEEDSAIHEFATARSQASELVNAAAKATLSPERFQIYQKVLTSLDNLDLNFKRLLDLVGKTQVARSGLFTGGEELTAATIRLVELTRQGHQELTVGASQIESAVLQLRVANWRFIATHDPKGPATFATTMAKAEKALADFQRQPRADGLRSAIVQVSSALANYRQDSEDISASMLQAKEHYDTTIARPLIDMQKQLEITRVSLLKDLQNTQADTNRQLSWTVLLTAIVAILTLALATFIAFVIARGIANPIATMTRAMLKLAGGDLSTEIPAREGKDEIAEMAGAVQVFKDNGIARQHLETKTESQRQATAETRRQNDEILAKAEKQRTFVVASVATALEELSSGRLAVRLTEPFAPEFKKLQDDFNSAMGKLQETIKDIAAGAVGVHANTQEIAATSKEQQATAVEIAATTTEIGATSKQISATSKDLVRTMTEVTNVAGHTATLAGSGQVSLAHMEETMRNVMEAAGSINAKLAILNEKAGNITQVVTTITKVADQTNLLSLNAAIEAEKAGEYGRGFAVVASEIRRLADQTAVATYDIEQMVKEIQSAVSAGVMGVDKFSEEVRRGMQEVQQVGGQLSQIIQQVQSVTPRFEAVNEGMQAQATGAEQISQALTQLSEAAQQTVEFLRQSGQAIDGLNQVSSGLRSSVSRFKLHAA